MTEAGNRKEKLLLRILLVSAVVIILALTGIIIYLIVTRPEAPTLVEEKPKRPYLVDSSNIDSIVEDALEAEPEVIETPKQYIVTMNSTWTFEDGSAISENAYVGNSRDNTTPVYFDVVRNDTGETVYRSPVIGVGEYLGKIRLDTDLDPGEYECTLTYYLIDQDQNVFTTVNMWLMLQIEN